MSWVRPWSIVPSVFLALALLLGARLLIQSRAELEEAEAHRDAGNHAAAIEHYRRAMRGATLLNPYPGRAAAALESLAERCELEADLDCALSAWRAMSGARAAVRWIGSVQDPLRAQADAQIARLLGAQGRVPIDAGLDRAALESSHRARLERAVQEPRLWRICLLAGFLLWLGGLLWLIGKGFDRRAVLLWPAARRPLSLALLGLTAFVFGLFFA